MLGGNGLSAAKDKALEFVEHSQYKKVKKQLQQFKATPIWINFFFPARIPIAAISGLLYDILLLTFIVCLMLTYENGSVRLAVFTDDSIKFTAVFVISIITIIIANIHALLLLNIILFIVVIIFAIAAVITVFLSPILLFVYFPTIACLGYSYLFHESRSASKQKSETDINGPTKGLYQLSTDVNDNTTGLEMENIAVETKI